MDHNNTSLPRTEAPYGLIASLWDRYLNSFAIYMLQEADALTLTWSGSALHPSGLQKVTYSVRLYQNGIIEVHLLDVWALGMTATIGIANASGQKAVQLPCSPNCYTQTVGGGQVIRFRPAGVQKEGPDLVVTLLDAVPPTLPLSLAYTPRYRVTNVGTKKYDARGNVHVFMSDAPHFRIFPRFSDPLAGRKISDDSFGWDEGFVLEPGAFFEGKFGFASHKPRLGTQYLSLWVRSFAYETDIANNFVPLGTVEVVE